MRSIFILALILLNTQSVYTQEKTKKHVLLINTYKGVFSEYNEWIPQEDFDVDYIVDTDGFEGIQERTHPGNEICRITDIDAWTEILKCAEEIKKKKGPFDFIVANDEYTITTAGKLRDIFGVTHGLSEKGALHFRNKFMMKTRIRERGLKTADFMPACASKSEIDKFVEQQKFPIVLKPLDESGSTGITIAKNQEELDVGLKKLEVPFPDENCTAYFIEKFVPGDIFHIDGIVFNDEMKWIRPSIYWNTNFLFYQRGMPNGSINLPKGELRSALEKFASDAVKALDYKSGVFHLEVIVNPQGEIHFLEIAARYGGGLIHNSILSTYGLNLARETIRLQLNIPPVFTEMNVQEKKLAGFLVYPPRQQGRCIIKTSRIINRDKLKTLYWYSLPEVGSMVKLPNFRWPMVGLFLFAGTDFSKIKQEMQSIPENWDYKTSCDKLAQ